MVGISLETWVLFNIQECLFLWPKGTRNKAGLSRPKYTFLTFLGKLWTPWCKKQVSLVLLPNAKLFGVLPMKDAQLTWWATKRMLNKLQLLGTAAFYPTTLWNSLYKDLCKIGFCISCLIQWYVISWINRSFLDKMSFQEGYFFLRNACGRLILLKTRPFWYVL